MPRNPIIQVYIAEGFADDCEELVHRCSRVDHLNYPTFCSHYKEMNFATVYQHRSTNAEIGELSEELLQIAKHYMVRDTSNFEESVAGLFLVYALLNLQPFPRFAALRIVQDDLPAIARLERVARRDNRLDVLYVLANVLVRGPVQFHAEARPRGMEAAYRTNLEGFCNIDAHGVRPKGVYSRQNEELDLLRDMNSIFERYSKAKAQIPGFQRRDISHNLAMELSESLKRVINGVTDDPEESSVLDHHDSVQEIKKRAMRNAVSTVRFLDSTEQRQKTSTPAGSKDGAKRRKSSKKSPKTKLNSSSSSEEDEDDKEIEILAKDVMSQASFREIIKDKETQLNIDSLPRLLTTESNGKLFEIEIIDEMKQPSLPVLNENDGKIEIEISDQMNSSATPINSENDGKLVEIEISDKVTNPNEISFESTVNDSTVEKEVTDSTKKRVREVDETKDENEDKIDRPKKRGRPKKNEKSPTNEGKKTNDDLFLQPLRVSPRLKTVLKRDQKKPVLKSKFKKMGMLELANFEDKK
ncbi:uncharacterized protein LOC133517348 [Cydia pomonella]|uniref:uncharacterized protein LOC133517348 n=1 Tax=Cydia pomonella TaxID=82600 RepID=UPI002ADDF0F3|nr:uncharacterized protein LOC133517348 [Cydia pomonella]